MNRFTSCALVTRFALAACTEASPELEMLSPDAGELDDSDIVPEPEPMPEPKPMPEPEPMPEPKPMPEPFVCGDSCEVQSQGVCYLNECMLEYGLGFPDGFNRNAGGPLPSFIWGFAMVVDSPNYVTSLSFVGLPGPPDGASADGHIALYSDNSGVPADLYCRDGRSHKYACWRGHYI